MTLRSILSRLGLGNLFPQKLVVENPDQLAEQVRKYWAAWLAGDYRTAFDMMDGVPPEIGYEDWREQLRLGKNQQDGSDYKLVSCELYAISQCPYPDLTNYFDVVARLKIESSDGKTEEGLQNNVWSIDDRGNWHPAMPVNVEN